MHQFQAVQAQRSPKSPRAFQAFRAWKEPERSPKARPETRTKFWKARKLEKPENARPEKTLNEHHHSTLTTSYKVFTTFWYMVFLPIWFIFGGQDRVPYIRNPLYLDTDTINKSWLKMYLRYRWDTGKGCIFCNFRYCILDTLPNPDQY